MSVPTARELAEAIRKLDLMAINTHIKDGEYMVQHQAIRQMMSDILAAPEPVASETVRILRDQAEDAASGEWMEVAMVLRSAADSLEAAERRVGEREDRISELAARIAQLEAAQKPASETVREMRGYLEDDSPHFPTDRTVEKWADALEAAERRCAQLDSELKGRNLLLQSGAQRNCKLVDNLRIAEQRIAELEAARKPVVDRSNAVKMLEWLEMASPGFIARTQEDMARIS